MDARELGSLQIDGLREVANVGAGHAATALSQMTDDRILIDVPDVRIIEVEEIARLTGAPDDVVAAVLMKLLGDATGQSLHVFPPAAARRLAGVLLRRDEIDFPDGFGELERSALKEAANILGGAYLNALSDMLGMLLLSSVPALSIDLAAAVLTASAVESAEESGFVLCIDTRFRMGPDEEAIQGHVLLLPDAVSLDRILGALRLA